jgi:hypothetical protein
MEHVGHEVESEQVSLMHSHCRLAQPSDLSHSALTTTAEAPGPSLSALGPQERFFLTAVDSREISRARRPRVWSPWGAYASK